MIDFDSMSIQEIEALIHDAQAAIEHRRLRAKAELRARLATEAEALGFSLEDVLREFAENKSTEKATKGLEYRNPENPDQVWRGDGKKPGWIKDWEAGGGLLSDLLKIKPKPGGAAAPRPRIRDVDMSPNNPEMWTGGPGAKPPGS